MNVVVDIFDVLYQQAITLLGYFADSSQWVYWLYLIGSLIPIYLLVQLSPLYRGQSFFKLVFSPRVWWHKSARQDYLIFIVNRFLRVLVYAPLLISMVPIAVFVSDQLERVISSVLFADSPQWLVVLCFTTILFVCDDFSRF